MAAKGSARSSPALSFDVGAALINIAHSRYRVLDANRLNLHGDIGV